MVQSKPQHRRPRGPDHDSAQVRRVADGGVSLVADVARDLFATGASRHEVMRAAPSVSRAPGLPLLRRCSWTSWRRPPTPSGCHRLTRFHGPEGAVDDAEL